MSTYGCNAGKTFAEAAAICSAKSLRLCTQAEIGKGLTIGTGCGYDLRRVWTSIKPSCPVPKCPKVMPKPGCKIVKNKETNEDGCLLHPCGKHECKVSCPTARCLAPKEGCKYVKSDEKNANGCARHPCGKLQCDGGPTKPAVKAEIKPASGPTSGCNDASDETMAKASIAPHRTAPYRTAPHLTPRIASHASHARTQARWNLKPLLGTIRAAKGFSAAQARAHARTCIARTHARTHTGAW